MSDQERREKAWISSRAFGRHRAGPARSLTGLRALALAATVGVFGAACSQASTAGSSSAAATTGSGSGGGTSTAASSSTGTGTTGSDALVPIDLSDVSTAAGMPLASGECMLVHDFDGDGKPDLLLSPLSDDENSQSLVLYLNHGDMTFTPIPLPLTSGRIGACSIGDYDNDGRSDIAVIDAKKGQVLLLHNESMSPPVFKGAFLPENVAPPDQDLFLVTFIDLDADGFLDLYLGTSLIPDKATYCDVTADDVQCHIIDSPPARRTLLKNDGGKGYLPSKVTVPDPHPPFSYTLSSVDWDEDGAVDLYPSGDFAYNQLLHNEGGKLVDLLPGLGASLYNHGMGATFADFNHDGHWDFYVGDLGPDQVWMGDGKGGIVDRAGAMGVEKPTATHVGWGPIAADLNNDGWDDVYIGNSLIASSMQDLADLTIQGIESLNIPTDSYLFMNDHGKTFVMKGIPYEKAHHRSHVRSAVGDFDGDGLLDLIEGPLPLRMLHNDTKVVPASSHWIDLRLKGHASKANAHGAVVRLEVGGAPAGMRAAESNDGFSESTELLHFGLGSATEASKIHILWPGGAVQDVPGPIAGDRVVEITQP